MADRYFMFVLLFILRRTGNQQKFQKPNWQLVCYYLTICVHRGTSSEVKQIALKPSPHRFYRYSFIWDITGDDDTLSVDVNIHICILFDKRNFSDRPLTIVDLTRYKLDSSNKINDGFSNK